MYKYACIGSVLTSPGAHSRRTSWLPRGLILVIRPSRGLKPSGPELGWDRRESHSLDWPNQFCLHIESVSK